MRWNRQHVRDEAKLRDWLWQATAGQALPEGPIPQPAADRARKACRRCWSRRATRRWSRPSTDSAERSPSARRSSLNLSLEAGGFGLELQLARIVADDADIGLGESVFRVGLDLQRQLHLGAYAALQFHHHRVQDGVERLHRPNHVDFDRSVEPPRLLCWWRRC